MCTFSTRVSVLVVGWFGILLSLFLAPDVQANIGREWWGDLAAEPSGLKAVAVSGEKLTIDLRPLATLQRVQVEAIYQLHNPENSKRLKLVFVAGTVDVSAFQVRLDNQVLESSRVSAGEISKYGVHIPESWQRINSMPGIDRAETYARWSQWTLVRFAVEIPSGTHTLAVSYTAKAAGTDEGYPTATWQFPYILAPARDWGSFGGLDVTVYFPEGWQYTTSPPMENEAGILRGTFSELPADILQLAFRAPVGSELQRARVLYGGFFALAVIGGGALCWWSGRSLGRFLARRVPMDSLVGWRFGVRVLPAALLLAGLWTALICVSWRVTMLGIIGSLAGQESPYFHENFFGVTCFALFLMVACPLLGLLIIWRSASRQVHASKCKRSTD